MVLLISSEAEFENILRESTVNLKLVIVDFFTTWCGPCNQFAPEFEKLSNEFSADANFVKVDCDILQDLAMRLKIRSLPTVKGFLNMQESFSLVGINVIKLAKEIRKNLIIPILKTICIKVPETKPRMYLLKIVENIIKHPTDEKYRILKLCNESVKQNLLAHEDVKECLLSLGFQEEDDRLYMEEPTSFDIFKQFRKQLTILVAKIETASYIGQTSNANVIQCGSKQTPTTLVNKSNAFETNFLKNVAISTQDHIFIETLNSYRRKINIYENIDLMNIVNILVDIESYKNHILSQETILKRLLRWFKYDFFSWFDAPNCSPCNKPFIFFDNDVANSEESKWLASTVELYRCETCLSTFRFPRYNHPEKLLSTRTGRCGEWANCFSMILRTFINEAIFKNARIVFDWSDHVWCELFMKLDDEDDLRWIHVDPCEGSYNAPLVYEAGWNKKISYVIGISLVTGDVQDVTWRYTNNFKSTLSNRKLINENYLVDKLIEIHKTAGTDIKMIFKELVSFLPGKIDVNKISEKELMGRTTGSLEWRQKRGEIGNKPIWQKLFLGQNIKPTQFELNNNCIHIQYNCSLDAYNRPFDVELNTSISGEGEVRSTSQNSDSSSRLRKTSSANKNRVDLLSHDTEGWQSLAASWLNIKRKVEYDWEVVYLARMDKSPSDASGQISWTIDLSDSKKTIKEISVFASSAEFNNASVKWKLHSGAIEMPINGFVTTTRFNSCLMVTLTAVLESDPVSTSTVSWQHAQLCRQKSTDFDVKTLQIKIDLLDS